MSKSKKADYRRSQDPKFDWGKAGVNTDAFQFKRKLPAYPEVNPFDPKAQADVQKFKGYSINIVEACNGYFICYHPLYGFIPICPRRWRIPEVHYCEDIESARYLADSLDPPPSMSDELKQAKYTIRSW